MSYISYTHVERLEHPNVEGLLIGECYVFPKLDGTNAVLWYDDEQDHVGCGSRRRDLSKPGADDNHGFRESMQSRDVLGDLNWLRSTYDGVAYPIFYGEWLVPHTLKTYRPEAWREFYVFDARCPETGRYLPYESWAPRLLEAGAKVIEPLSIITNPTVEDITKIRDHHNTYLIAENGGVGEGVVVKNYSFRNHVGKTVWGKSVRNDFKEDNRRAFGTPERNGSFQVEAAIAEHYITPAFVEKTREKVEHAIIADVEFGMEPQCMSIQLENRRRAIAERRGQLIPRLLQTVYSELIEEETSAFVKKFKDPTIDFKKLRQFVIAETKKYAADLF